MLKKAYKPLLGLTLLCGLLVTFAEGVQYKINGNYTQISIPKDEVDGVSVNRGDGSNTFDFSLESEYCNIRTIGSGYNEFIQCSNSYTGGEYTVTINGVGNIYIIYLDGANIVSLDSLSGFSKLKDLHLDNNNIQVESNTFSSSNFPNLSILTLTYNNLTSFPASLFFSNIRVDLKHNNLPTIPPSLLDDRRSEITLPDGSIYTHGSNNYAVKRDVDLRYNPINFIEINEVPAHITDTSYNFTRFAYSFNGYTNFSYKVDSVPSGETTNTGVTLTNLENGYHTIEVCYSDDSSICDDLTFHVKRESSLSITSPTEDQKIEGKNHTFKWSGSHPYLYEFCYQLNRVGGGYSTKSDCTTSTSLPISDLVDGTYTFRVSMNDDNNTELAYEIRNFTVKLNRSVTIDAIQNPITSKNYTFSRNGTADDFLGYYTYSLTKNDSSYSTGGTINSNNLSVSDLTDGIYTLNVIIEGAGGTGGDTKEFNVAINKSLSVSSNPSGTIRRNNVTGVNVTINWEGENDWFGGYNYELKRNGTTYGAPGTHTNEAGSKLYEMLPSGTYNFHIDMISRRDGSVITSGDVDFNIIIPTTLTLNSPNLDGNNVTLGRTGFAENFHHYEYSLDRTDSPKNVIQGTRNKYYTGFTVPGLHYGNYTLTVNMKDSGGTTITGKNVSFQISDNLDLASNIYVGNTAISSGGTIKSRSATFTWNGQSEDLAGFYYEISGTTFKNEAYKESGIQTSGIGGELYKAGSGSITLSNLQTGKYKFTIKMLSGNTASTAFNEKSIDFNVSIPATLTITSPKEGATITSDKTTFSWEGYSDVIEKYGYALTYGDQPVDTNNFTNSTSITSPTLKNGNYTLTVWIISGVNVAQDTIHFTVAIPPKVTGGSSGKTHYTNNLKLSLGNDSPAANEWIKLIVKIDDKYVGKVTFPKLQHYSADTEKREDIPVTSKNYVADYSDDAKLGYIKFASDEDGRKDLEQFIKFSKNGYYRIYAEDKDGYDTYVEFKVSGKTTQTSTTTENNNTVSNTSTVDSIIQQYIPEVYRPQDTSEEVYIARSCKKYTIKYSESLNVYTSPNLNMNEYFVSKDYFKRYVDSKNKYQSGCPTNVGWISTNYADRTNDDTRYTAPNGKVYFITGRDGNYYSNELNKELKTPTSFGTIQELKYYIRDRNPLINMAALGPAN